jgi:hypothetical protein
VASTTGKPMTRQAAVAFIRNTQGRIFTVEFVKRSTGELRQMAARTGVRSRLTGNGAAYNAEDHGLICVFDMVKDNYRCIPVEGITRVKIKGTWHKVT